MGVKICATLKRGNKRMAQTTKFSIPQKTYDLKKQLQPVLSPS